MIDADILELIDREVRPKLREHGGDLQVCSYRDGALQIRLLGQCAQCPASWVTTEQLVAQTVMGRFPQVKAVFLEQGVSLSLQGQARQLLERRRAEKTHATSSG